MYAKCKKALMCCQISKLNKRCDLRVELVTASRRRRLLSTWTGSVHEQSSDNGSQLVAVGHTLSLQTPTQDGLLYNDD